MRVRVLFFGQLREIVGRAMEEAELSEGARLEDLFERYRRLFPELAAFRSSIAASVNQEYASWRATLSADDEVAFLPPVSGGQEKTARAAGTTADLCRLTREPIRAEELVQGLKGPGDGGLVMFDGFVREESAGRRTLYLEYEAYEPMALAKMSEIISAARAKFSVGRIAIVHRLGRLGAGETSVFIAVSAPHRAAAFDACRYAIDALKQTVPIWKKEFFADGATWAEGTRPCGEAISEPSSSSHR